MNSSKTRVPFIVDPETGCHLWQRYINPDGYGRIRVNGRTINAHVYYYELKFGPVPEGMELDHVRERGCRYRHCVNADHLEPVTTGENQRRGSNAKLTWDDVAKIRALGGTMTQSEIALLFGVKQPRISAILLKKSWVEGPCDVSLNSKTLLTEEQARSILSLRGIRSAEQIGREFDVGGTTVRDIWKHRTWKHLADD